MKAANGLICVAALLCAISLFCPCVQAETAETAENFLASAEVQDRAGEIYAALADYERAEALEPQNRAAIRGVVLTEDRIGAMEIALEKLQRHENLFNAAERRRIEGDVAAAEVRRGALEPQSAEERFAVTDRAIARLDALIARWSQEGVDARGNILRARFDRMIALRNRMRMQDVVEEYQALSAEGVDTPTYARGAVAEAYLYLRAPETARDLDLKILETQPHDFEAQAQLFFAYMECDDTDDAYALIDAADQEQPLWIPLRGSPVPLPNPARQRADLFAADARMDSGEFDASTARVAAIIGAAPFDARDRYALGNLYLSRGLPNEARMQYEIGENIEEGHDVENETGIASADLDLQNFQASETETAGLVRRFPEQTEVQRAARLLDVHNMAEAQVLAGYGSPVGSTSQTNGQSYDIETILYSPPVAYNWRLFAGELFAHGSEPNDEGHVGYWRNAVGVEYRGGGLTAEIAPTENLYHAMARTGIGGNAGYMLNDAWSIFGGGELFSRDTPIRALNTGVTANEAKLGAQWRENESKSDRLSLTIVPFSDGNTQFGFANNYLQRIYASPHWAIDGLFDASASQSTANENRTYYNPSRDFLGLIGARATEILYRRYETVYQHSLSIQPGAYWEQHFGGDGVIDVRYENRLLLNDVFEAGLGVDFIRRPYDGAPENDIAVSLDLTRRF